MYNLDKFIKLTDKNGLNWALFSIRHDTAIDSYYRLTFSNIKNIDNSGCTVKGKTLQECIELAIEKVLAIYALDY